MTVEAPPAPRPPDPRLEALLLARREDCNRRFLLARHQHPHLQPAAFATLLRDLLPPALAPLPDEAAAAALPDLYDLLIEAAAHRMIGPDAAHAAGGIAPVERVWRDLLPALPHLLPRAREIVPLLGNAAWNIAQDNARLDRWIAGMRALAPRAASPDLLRRLCAVQSWRHGLAWMRRGALALWRDLPPDLQPAALGLPDGADPDRLAADLADPWKKPGTPDRERPLDSRSLGGFRGFGGPFLTPPTLSCVSGRFYAFADGLCWAVDTDCFGATLRRCPAPPAPPAIPDHAFRLDPDGTVHHLGRLPQRRTFAALTAPRSVAASAHTLMVCPPHSFKIVVIGPFGEVAPRIGGG